MSSQIQITPLGTDDSAEVEGSYYSFILQIDSVKILLDCGCTESFNFSNYDAHRKTLQQLDCILVSHADLRYIGALPYIVEKFSLTCPIYMTVPVHNMGLMTLYDMMHNLSEEGLAPETFTLDDVDSCFDKVVRLRFMQNLPIPGTKGISIVAYAAGHSVGACLWKLSKNTEDIVYAIDFNHKKERHLDGIAFEQLQKPSILITSSSSIFSLHHNKKQRDSDFTNSAISALRAGGNVLVPVKSATRVLELLLLLEQTWQSQNLAYPIYFVTHQSFRIIEFAKSMLEWMGEAVVREFGSNRNNPFVFQHVKLASSLEECDSAGPKMFLSSSDSLTSGFAKQLFLRLVTNPMNLVIFVSERRLYDSVKKTGTVIVELRKKVPLENEELAAFKKQELLEEERKIADAAFQAVIKRKHKSDAYLSSDEEQEETEQNDLEKLKLTYWYDYQYDFYCKNTVTMFPCIERSAKFDDYGETIQIDDFSNEPIKEAKQEEQARQQPVIPHKWTSTKVHVNITCKIAYIDFEGLSDGRSIKTIISRIAPRKLVITGGSSITRQYMMQFCKVADEITNNISIANPLVTTNISSSLDIFNVRIDEELLQSLQIKSFQGYELAHVTGTLSFSDNQRVLKLAQTEKSHEPLLIGNPKLFQIKKQLISLGFKVDLTGGTLKCGNVIVSKNQGVFTMEGPLSLEYFAVRDSLYSQMALI